MRFTIIASCLMFTGAQAENFLRDKNHLSLYSHVSNKIQQLNENSDKVKEAITEYNACNYNSNIGTFYHINGIVDKDLSNTQQVQTESILLSDFDLEFNFCKMPIKPDTVKLICPAADANASTTAHAVMRH